MNNIETYTTNKNGELHGYQEHYDWGGELSYRGNCKNDDDIGYQEYHRFEAGTIYNIRWNYG